MNIDYREFEPWHIKLFESGDKYARPDLDNETRAYIYRQTKGVTLLINNEIAAILGVAPLWNGVGEVTMIPSEVFYRYKKTCIKEIRKLIDLAFETYNVHRLQACTLREHEHHGRFMEFMGFTLETPNGIKGYGPKREDFNMYAKVRD